jgi:hypothetical protein
MRGTDPVCQETTLVEKLIHGLIRLIQFLYFSLLQRLKTLPPNPKQIFFTLDDSKLYRSDDGMGRYAYMTLNAFSRAGYNVYFYKKIDLMGFIKLGFYGRFIYFIKNLKIVSKLPPNSEEIIYAFDSTHEDLLKMKWQKLVYVNVLKPPACSMGETIWIPYYFHPHMYRLEQYHKIESLRNKKRRLKIFFGGNASRTYYTNPNPSNNYGQLTRQEGIDALLEMSKDVQRVEYLGDFLRILKSNDYRNQCWILETNRCGNTEFTQWFEIVASADFFMCFSGTDLPMCHNSIEAMAVGTIPILSYSDWFFPPLEHKKNAIIYSGKEDLRMKIQEVLSMGKKEIETMRRNVVSYYDQYLSNESFIRNFERNEEEKCTIMLHPKLASTVKDDQEGKEFLKRLKTILESGSPMDLRTIAYSHNSESALNFK